MQMGSGGSSFLNEARGSTERCKLFPSFRGSRFCRKLSTRAPIFREREKRGIGRRDYAKGKGKFGFGGNSMEFGGRHVRSNFYRMTRRDCCARRRGRNTARVISRLF